MTQDEKERRAINAADACVFAKFGSYDVHKDPTAMTFWIEVFYKVFSNEGRI